jgi:hypothetical protein
MIKFLINKFNYFKFAYNSLVGVNQGKLRITKKGNVKKAK